jgi:excinuclease ABC subunit A
VPVTPQSFEAIVAQIMRDFAGQSVELLAPLVINRKGLYTDLAKWARGKGFEQLRVDGDYLPDQSGRASTATRSTTSSCRWAW